jgi:hypothetical protein
MDLLLHHADTPPLHPTQEMDALPASLQFLGPDKIRERDPVLRLMCVEILMLLATSE